jgi:photosystem II stability/assembly factor-like uncharacterized protein
MDEELLIAERNADGTWNVETKLKDTSPQSVACDPFNPTRVYCGTFERGLWLSDDSGKTWRAVDELAGSKITSVAVSTRERQKQFGFVYVGTEPSMLYRSEDGGGTWEKSERMSMLPSAGSWSFPPRPDTHHVRNITLDQTRPGLIYLAIEAGALIRSNDGGKTWEDRVEDGPYDTHTLTTNPNAPGRVYSAAGDGYFESLDYGKSWQRPDRGLEHSYLFSVAVHPDDPNTVLVSASHGPFSAYNPQNAESYVYLKTHGKKNWQRVGLPQPRGTTVSVVLPGAKKEFYAANNRGVYRSEDAGNTWEKLDMPWQESFKEQHAWSMAIQ